jgi:hypothetical protein
MIKNETISLITVPLFSGARSSASSSTSASSASRSGAPRRSSLTSFGEDFCEACLPLHALDALPGAGERLAEPPQR